MAEKEIRKSEDKMGTKPVAPLLIGVSVPIVISMLVQALYNIVDSIYVAQYSDVALLAVNYAFPMQNFLLAVAVGTAIGVGSLLSRRLGEQNIKAAERVAANGIMLAILSWLVFALIGIFFSDAYFAGYVGKAGVDPTLPAMGASYMRIVTIGSLGMFVAITFERLIQSTGRSVFTMVSQLTGAVVNIILDPIMIFGLLGFPEMGITGAAIATVIGQWVSMGLSMIFCFMHVKEFKVTVKGFRFHARTVGQIYKVGLPSIIMQSIGSAMVFFMNEIMDAAGGLVMGVYFKLQSFIFMPVFGFNNGMVPIVAYNFGARKRKRIEDTIKISIIICIAIMLLGTLAFELIPGPLLKMFKIENEVLELGILALRIIAICFPLAGFNIVCSGVFQALGKGFYSLMISVIRQVLVLIPAAWIFINTLGQKSVWWSFPVSEAVAFVITVFMLGMIHKRYIKNIENV